MASPLFARFSERISWRYGYTLNARSSSSVRDDAGDGRSAVPEFVPERYAGAIA